MDLDTLARPLAFAGLLIGTELYFLLIRRRRQMVEDQKERSAEESRRRTMMRLRHLRRRDER